jgi:prolyl-tRNA editing enzyme YbaK/EbsC (Cys-tRNA(Pro) deacylase)
VPRLPRTGRLVGMTDATSPAASADGDLGAEHLRAWLERHGVAARIVVPGVPTPTVPDAAAALGVEPRAILKSLVFLVEGAPMLVVAAGEDRLPYPALARAFGVSRRRIRLADADETRRITGYVVGAMPPFGHRTPLPTVVDAACVAGRRTVYGGGGARDALLELSTDVLLATTNARVEALTEPPHERTAP